MTPTNFTYSRTVKPADYEAETISVSATLEEGDDLGSSVEEVKGQVLVMLGGAATAEATTTTATATKTAKKTTKKVAKKVAKKVTKKAPAKKVSKNVAYDRTIKAHKAALGKILFDNYDGWDKDEVLSAKAAELSADLVGTDMLDAEGNVLDSFILSVTGPMDSCFEGGEEEEGVL